MFFGVAFGVSSGKRMGLPVATIVLSNSTIAENAALGAAVGTLSVINATGTPTFTLTDNAGSRFALSGANLQRGATALDYEAATSHNIIVSCTGMTPSPSNATINIQVTNIAEVPVLSVAPTLSPTSGAVGTLITCGTGTWTLSPTSYAYQWMRTGVDISGATSSTYTSVIADDTLTLTCKVLASNADGPAAGYSTTSNSHTVAASWTPASLGSALRVWLKADTGITLNTTKVAAWADQSGNTIDFAQVNGGKQPTYDATGFNGRPTVSFSVADVSDIISASNDVFNIGSASSWFFVGQMHVESAFYARFFSYEKNGAVGAGDHDTPDRFIPMMRDFSYSAFEGYYNSAATATQAISLATDHRLGAIWDGVNFTPYLNNVAGTPTAMAPNMGGAGGRLCIANVIAGTNTFFDGLMSEIVITNTALSVGDRASLDNYFKAKWGLS